jgi:branched-chain amino acid transport system permease protein
MSVSGILTVPEQWSIDRRRSFYGLIAAGVVIMIGLNFVGGNYVKRVGFSIFMYIALAGAWNYVSGFTGYVTFGPTMFFALGAYVMGLSVTVLELSWISSLPVVILSTILVAPIIGYILMRISGAYFVVGTFMLAEALRQLAFLAEGITGGASGMVVTVVPVNDIYFLFGGLAVVMVILTYETATSAFGHRMMAIREDEGALQSLGVNPLKYKLSAFTVHGVITGMAGAIFVLNLGSIYPNSVFNISYTIALIIMVILGSSGTVWGPVIGAVILVPIEEAFWLQFPNIYLIAFGIFLMAIIVLLPEGIITKLKSWEWLPRSRGV